MIYISIESNLGNQVNKRSLDLLKKIVFLTVNILLFLKTLSPSLPPNVDMQWNKPYLNVFVQGESTLIACRTQKIEQQMGRVAPYDKWAPRIIDLDILLWDDQHINLPSLKIPHSELLTHLTQ